MFAEIRRKGKEGTRNVGITPFPLVVRWLPSQRGEMRRTSMSLAGLMLAGWLAAVQSAAAAAALSSTVLLSSDRSSYALC